MTVRRRIFQTIAAVATLATQAGPTTASAQQPSPPQYESTMKLVIVYHDIRDSATPVPVDEVAEMHVAMIASPRIAQAAIKKHLLNELPSLADLPAQDVPQALSSQVSATCKPAGDAPNAGVLELRYRSVNSFDVTTVPKALWDAYRDALDQAEPQIQARLRDANRLHDELTRKCDDLRRTNQTDELARTEPQLREAKTNYYWLRLKARVGRFETGELEEPVVVKVEPK